MNRAIAVICAGLCLIGVLALGGLAWPVASSYLAPRGPAGVIPISDATPRVEPISLDADLAATGARRGDHVHLRIFKRERLLELWVKGDGPRYRLFKTYPICNLSGQPGPKLAEGDLQAPEGFYRVAARQLNPNSRYHLAFNLGFPNALDQQLGRTGSLLMVHGGERSAGCFAMGDRQIEEIYGLVAAALGAGQGEIDVAVFPFRLTAEALAAAQHSPWAAFWANLKQGADWFDRDGLPPRVAAQNGVYRFGEESFEPGCVPIIGWV